MLMIRKEKIALLTYKEKPLLTDGEKLLLPAFYQGGIEVAVVPWDGSADWDQFSTIIPRTCWNYHLKRGEFLRFLERMDSKGIHIWNPLPVIQWNTDKKYLKTLEQQGVRIIPTEIIEPGNQSGLMSILSKNNWDEGVLKPTVGASSFGVIRFDKDTAAAAEKTLKRDQPWFIQRYCPEVKTEGEYSLLFFGKKYSHAVIKKPKHSDFRSQPEFGGTEREIAPDRKIIDQAAEILDKVTDDLLYARIDGLIINGNFHLMELELTEPYLYFEFHPLAARRFVEAFKKLAHTE